MRFVFSSNTSSWDISKFLILLFFIGCNSPQSKTESAPLNKATLEFEIKAKLGEGAFWNHRTQEFYWIDIEAKSLHIYNPKTKSNKSFPTPSRIGTVVPKNSTEAVVALEDGVYLINTESGDISLLSDIENDKTQNRFNDGKCDPSGRLWVGSMALDQKKYSGSLYMIDESGRTELKIDRVTISNGIVWTSNHKTMYYIDTATAKIRAFDFDNNTGNISNERVVIEVNDSLGFPDGMAIDEEDMLWVGMWNGNAVVRFDPNTGEIISKIEVPAHNVTSCAFGGKLLDTLYITTASVDMTPEEHAKYPLAGSLFQAVPGVKGVKSSFFGK
ncbi:MAG: sugar lactone lactonase YvrE [Ulvibacter sp.]|jgi:sugar lactone lactonase YvrE